MTHTWKKHLPHRPYVKQILALFLCFVLLSSGIPAAAAAGSTDNRTVAAGVFFFDGYHMRGDDGSYTGHGIELLGLISRYSHLNFEFTGYYNTWAETQSMLLDGEIDVATSARKTPERMELYEGDWSDILYDKYYGTDIPDSNEFSQWELNHIKAVASGEKRITVTAMPGRRPYSYVEDGELKGIVPQFFDRLMQLTGLPYEVIVPEDTAEYDRLVEGRRRLYAHLCGAVLCQSRQHKFPPGQPDRRFLPGRVPYVCPQQQRPRAGQHPGQVHPAGAG